MLKTLDKIESYIVYAMVLFVPIAVFPVSPNPYVVTKLAVLLFGLCLLLVVKSFKIIASGKLNLTLGNFDLPVLLIIISYILSTILRTPNKMEALLLPGTTTLIVGSGLFYFLVNQLGKKDKGLVKSVLVFSGAFYSLIIILAGLSVFAQIPQLPLFMKSTVFSPEGGYLPAFVFLLVLLPLSVGSVFFEENKRKKVLSTVCFIFIAIAFVYSAYNIIPGKPNAPRFPGVNTSWYIAVDTLKESPILGAGPGNYLTAFNRFRPLSFNMTDLWAIKFSTSGNYFMTGLTETGLLGAAGFIFLLLLVYKVSKRDILEKRMQSVKSSSFPYIISLILIILLLALFPANPTGIFALFVLLALNAKTKETSLSLTSQVQSVSELSTASGASSRIPTLFIALPVMGLALYSFLFGVRVVRAEFMYQRSLSALARNEGVLSYDYLQKAINTNPGVDRYHSSYSQVNLLLANAIAMNEDITDTDRSNIAQLIQQAIREAKATVALNPFRAGNWEVLARTYRSIMPLAVGADVFAAQTFSQAVALDPINPNTRISLGGIYYAVGDFETAARSFELAVLAKRDLANAHFNLAFALEKMGNLGRAIEHMTFVLSLVERDSDDYENARQVLENLQESQKLQAEGTEGLTPPREAGDHIIQPPLELPEDSEPPEAPDIPTPVRVEDEEEENPDEDMQPATPEAAPGF